MLRQILIPTESRLVLELPAEFIGQEIEVLAFPVEDSSKRPSDAIQQADLLSFANVLCDSPNFNGELVEWQRAQRDEWN
ncbi:hypothetical protein MTYM_01230 [Methylococcales bacterium]|nr:hypothetical protein MTYM_01230 [Methylococcales bacterium]